MWSEDLQPPSKSVASTVVLDSPASASDSSSSPSSSINADAKSLSTFTLAPSLSPTLFASEFILFKSRGTCGVRCGIGGGQRKIGGVLSLRLLLSNQFQIPGNMHVDTPPSKTPKRTVWLLLRTVASGDYLLAYPRV